MDVETLRHVTRYENPDGSENWEAGDLWDDNFEANAIVGQTTEIPGYGTFTVLAQWGEVKDGMDMGFVVRHEESGKEFLFTCTYTSWDSQDWSISEAEEYTFTEQRWRPL